MSNGKLCKRVKVLSFTIALAANIPPAHGDSDTRNASPTYSARPCLRRFAIGFLAGWNDGQPSELEAYEKYVVSKNLEDYKSRLRSEASKRLEIARAKNRAKEEEQNTPEYYMEAADQFFTTGWKTGFSGGVKHEHEEEERVAAGRQTEPTKLSESAEREELELAVYREGTRLQLSPSDIDKIVEATEKLPLAEQIPLAPQPVPSVNAPSPSTPLASPTRPNSAPSRIPIRGVPQLGGYIGVGSGHWIQENGSGKIITLEDGSVWQISDYDQSDTTLWLPITDITVIENNNSFYPYKLINTEDGETAEAKLLHQ